MRALPPLNAVLADRGGRCVSARFGDFATAAALGSRRNIPTWCPDCALAARRANLEATAKDRR